MKCASLLAILAALFVAEALYAQTDIFNVTPDWSSEPMNHVATGLGVADINGDGWDDIVVANGNDIHRQAVVVYYNNGDGTFPHVPSWTSGDIDYHGHLSVGDVNGDNTPDVAVSVFLGPGEFDEPGGAKIYFNEGDELESFPSYRTVDSTFTFSCALGDADGDGDLDLAVAGGQPYDIGVGPYLTYGRIYYNHGDSIQTTPGWQSNVEMAAMDVDFADMDGNGFLDLIFANHLTPNYIFLADSNGSIETQPSWSSGDGDYHANSLTIARVDSNDFRDLIVSDNRQLGGQGKFKAYIFDSTPVGESSPGWFSGSGGYGSAILAEDLDNDGFADLLAGRWWGSIHLYPGIRDGFETTPGWMSSTHSVVEAFALRDVDQDNWFDVQDTVNVAMDSIHVVYLSRRGVEKILSVELNGLPLTPGDDFCSVPGMNWISTRPALRGGDQLIVEYAASLDRDLVVTNWDSGIGNYLFYNQLNPSAVAEDHRESFASGMAVFPNPFNDACVFRVDTPRPSQAELSIFDICGRTVRKFRLPVGEPGGYELRWDGRNGRGEPVASGMYIYRLNLADRVYAGKVALIR